MAEERQMTVFFTCLINRSLLIIYDGLIVYRLYFNYFKTHGQEDLVTIHILIIIFPMDLGKMQRMILS